MSALGFCVLISLLSLLVAQPFAAAGQKLFGPSRWRPFKATSWRCGSAVKICSKSMDSWARRGFTFDRVKTVFIRRWWVSMSKPSRQR